LLTMTLTRDGDSLTECPTAPSGPGPAGE
jgi:hypothetical protein